MKLKSILPITASIGVAMLLIAVTAVMSWNDDPSSTVSTGRNSASSVEDMAKYVFPKDKVVDVKITIDDADFQDMLDNASAEEMKPATVEYNGIKLDNVGIRTKGNLSLRSVVNSDSERYSLKLSFDEYLSTQKLYGMSKINLNNHYSDASYMREFLAYELAETMGLPTPGYSYVNVYINDELWGFYLAVEQIDAAYLERNFGNSYGALYKAEFSGTGTDLIWKDNEADSYSGLVLKSETANGDVLTDMIDELNNGSNYESVLDIEEALRFIALNVVTVNWDSYLGSNKQNYYLYEDDGVFSVLPWDYNMAFGGGPGGSSILIDEPTQGALADRPLIAKLLANDAYLSKYHNILQQAVDGYLSTSTFQDRVEELTALISDYVKQDPSAFYTYEQYESGLTQLVASNASNTKLITQQLDGTIASTGDGSGSGGMGGDLRMNRPGGNDAVAATKTTNQEGTNKLEDNQVPPETEGIPKGFKPGTGFQGNKTDLGYMAGDMGGAMGLKPDGRGRLDVTANSPIGSTTELLKTGISILLLVAASFVVVYYKRKRL